MTLYYGSLFADYENVRYCWRSARVSAPQVGLGERVFSVPWELMACCVRLWAMGLLPMTLAKASDGFSVSHCV